MNSHPRIAHFIALATVAAAPSFAQIGMDNPPPVQVNPAQTQGITGEISAALSNTIDQTTQAASMLSRQFTGAAAALKSRYDGQVQASKSAAQTSAIRQQQQNEYAALRDGYLKRMDALQQQVAGQKNKMLQSLRAQLNNNAQQQVSTSQQPASASALLQDVAAMFQQLQNSVEVVKAKTLADAAAYAS
jgi:hypothetical protein